MAVWQIYFNIVNKNKSYNNEEDIYYWDNEPENLYDITFLRKEESWSEDIIQYGDLGSTCIELLTENQQVVEIRMRLDLRTLTEDLLIKVIDYVNKLDANLYYQNQIVVPSMDNICNIIKNSDAYRFCKNPNMYFENLIIENRTNI